MTLRISRLIRIPAELRACFGSWPKLMPLRVLAHAARQRMPLEIEQRLLLLGGVLRHAFDRVGRRRTSRRPILIRIRYTTRPSSC